MKITAKGQVTLPKRVREVLRSSLVTFDISGDTVVLKPVRDAGGSLSEFAKNAPRNRSFEQLRDMAWEQEAQERNARKSS